jgi:hypothetical protein
VGTSWNRILSRKQDGWVQIPGPPPNRRDMKQCMLVKYFNGHKQQQIAWLPEEFAVEGKLVDVKFRNEWMEGWTVVKVYRQMLTYDDVRQSESNQRVYGDSIKGA